MRIARALLCWYDAEKRALPWRARRDPYLVWLSEIMLQQTRIEVVRGYFDRFVAAFPTVRALALAPEPEVLRLWAGLGYYSRARNLHRAARAIVDRGGGAFPDTVEELHKLPGVGRYTAGAIASIAFGVRAPVLDGNVTRVLARLHAIRGDARAPDVQRCLWAIAESHVPVSRPGDFNEALMELGETVCTPRSPDCPRCPLARRCAARRLDLVAEIPAARAARARPEKSAVAGAVVRGHELLFVRRAPEGLLGGLWELPGAEVPSRSVGAPALERALVERVGLRARIGERLGTVRHVFTHRALTLTIFACFGPKGRVRLDAGYVDHAWLDPHEAPGAVALPALTKKALATLGPPR